MFSIYYILYTNYCHSGYCGVPLNLDAKREMARFEKKPWQACSGCGIFGMFISFILFFVYGIYDDEEILALDSFGSGKYPAGGASEIKGCKEPFGELMREWSVLSVVLFCLCLFSSCLFKPFA